MSIDWGQFTPWSALAGGALIGLAAAILILFNGRVAGISGIVANLRIGKNHGMWRWAFVLGLLLAPFLYRLVADLPAIQMTTNWPILMIAGFLVGYGSRLGSGCTSGHGVCGLSRRSPRSLVATLVFMSTGFMTVFVVRHLIGG